MITTTQSTLEDRLTSIPLSALSNTFRDAILFTRRLGIPYIWIVMPTGEKVKFFAD